MSEAFDEISEAFNKSAQRALKHYGEAITDYGRALNAYGKGDQDLTELTKTGVNLAIKQMQNAIEDGIAFSEIYYRWAFALAGINPLDKNQAANASAAEQSPSA
ncbi:MAG: hypothetical protein CTY29_08765 [Methylobacter sp.]|nr:MAG: hypothetical protein CTY29_08765 [Methylobacter sp.]